MHKIETDKAPAGEPGPEQGSRPEALIVRWLGRQPYQPVWAAMKDFTDARTKATSDELWLVEHDPVFTQGLAGRPEHLLNPGRIPVIQTDRGGQVTYHGPGQIVAYPLIDLQRSRTGVRSLVERLEQAVIQVLADIGLVAGRRDGAPGVFIGQSKIASIGLKVRRGCTFHGLAFNIDMDMRPFSLINPCGFAGLEMTQVADQAAAHADWDGLSERLVSAFCVLMGYHALRGDMPRLGTHQTFTASSRSEH